MKHCPVCESSLTEYPQCPRCGSDLSLLKTIQSQARQHLVSAIQCSINGDQRQANQSLQAAQQLNHDELTASIERLLSSTVSRSPSQFEAIKNSIIQRLPQFLKQYVGDWLQIIAGHIKP
jgi:restriction endonuclease Mrr